MNKILFIKDIKLLLKDLKFQIFFLILVALFILSAISSAVTYQNQLEEFQTSLNYHSEIINDGQSTQLINMLSSGYILNVNSRPSPALLFNSYDTFPDKIQSGVVFYTPEFGNFGSERKEVFRLNWFFILGILSGFIMLIMSFEAISQEKRAGTLRLVSIYGFKRQAILWHKYLSYMLLYMIIIVPPALISMVLFFALTGTWTVAFMLKFFLILLISLPFASFFVLLGIFISMSKNYRNAVVQIVFIWLLFVIIIPQSANIIAKQLSPVKTTIEYSSIENQAWNDEWNIWGDEYTHQVRGNGSIQDGLRAKAVYASDEKRNLMHQKELDDYKRQTLLIQNISSVSPFTQFERISEIVFDKGFYLFNFQQETAKRTINQIRNLMIEQDARDETSLNLFYSWASGDGGNIQHYGMTTFSTNLFEYPDMLFVTEIITDDAVFKTVKFLLRLLPILIFNVVLVLLSVFKLEKLDIR